MHEIPLDKNRALPLPFQTLGEEIANSILHGLGGLLAVTGLVFMVHRSGNSGKTSAVYVIFTATMIAMFLASTLYHAVQHAGVKRVLRVLDHAAIYLLIAGTYTPFCILGLGGRLGLVFLAFEWGLALLGIILYAANWKFLKRAELGVYILMGWAIIPGLFPLSRVLPRISMILLGAGGILYTLGTLWYRKPKIRGTHVIWHVFVLAGAACHWSSIWLI